MDLSDDDFFLNGSSSDDADADDEWSARYVFQVPTLSLPVYISFVVSIQCYIRNCVLILDLPKVGIADSGYDNVVYLYLWRCEITFLFISSHKNAHIW